MKPKQVTIVGGGVIGLCCAYYLRREGHEVTLIDAGDITNAVSLSHAGCVSPSHFVPLASPGMIGKALRGMLNSASPFYIKPRLDKDLLRWGMAFWHSSRKSYMQRSILPLHDLLHLSRELMNPLRDELGNHFRMQEKGCFRLFKTQAAQKRELQFALEAEALGIASLICDAGEAHLLEPHLGLDVLGGVLYPADCHLHPGEFMETLKARLIADGVWMCLNARVTGFRTQGQQVLEVLTEHGEIGCQELVLAAGSGLPLLTGRLGIGLLLQAGKGYSMTFPNVSPNLSRPVLLVERHVGLTPMGRDLHLGGTMELSGMNDRVLHARASAIYDAAKAYFPGLKVGPPRPEQVWTGLSPLSPDGLPYIGRPGAYNNLVIAGGHAMLGLSLSAATGKLVEELISGRAASLDLAPFSPERFAGR